MECVNLQLDLKFAMRWKDLCRYHTPLTFINTLRFPISFGSCPSLMMIILAWLLTYNV